ncbi:nitroreductase [Aurantivibrio infirmus]
MTTAVKTEDSNMSLIEAIYARRSVRGFLDKEIPEKTLQRVFDIAQRAPSNCNVQPWRVYVAKGNLKKRISHAMIENIKAEVPHSQDYDYRGDFVGEYRRKQVDCAYELYGNMGIERGDKEKRQQAFLRNYEFFDAPYMAFVGMDKNFGTTVALDVGMWAQNFMLTLVAFGLHSCAMGSMRSYPDLVRKEFELNDDNKILFGIAFGYEDTTVPANNTRIDRADIVENILIRE